jgi:hypothetical protein
LIALSTSIFPPTPSASIVHIGSSAIVVRNQGVLTTILPAFHIALASNAGGIFSYSHFAIISSISDAFVIIHDSLIVFVHRSDIVSHNALA